MAKARRSGRCEELPARIAALTSASIEWAAQTYLSTENYVKVTLARTDVVKR
jgi:predicted Zn-dependent peptidase